MRKNVVLCLVSGLLGAILAMTVYNQATSPDRLGAAEPPRVAGPRIEPAGPMVNTQLPNGVRPRPPIEDDLTLEERVNVAVYENVNRSVVNVDTKIANTAGFLMFDNSQEGAGSGSVLDKLGHILTNYHVIEGANKIDVTLFDGSQHEARVVGRDISSDVAVIKISAPPELLFPVFFGDSTRLKVGQHVFAIGNPFGLERTLTTGIVSSLNRSIPSRNNRSIKSIIQIDAAINPGNSGGPLVNIRGEVIGINSAIASQTGMYAGYGFAIPVTLAKQVMDDLLAYGKVRRSVIGVAINPASPEEAKAAGLDQVTGVVVGSYSYGADSVSPAKNAGIEPGDVIIAADGKPIDRVSTLQRIVRSHKPGETVSFDVMRFGSKKTYRVKLVEAPDETRAVASASRSSVDEGAPSESRRFDKVGIAVEPVSAGLRAVVAEPYRRGLVVSDVSAMGPSYRKLTADQTVLYEVLNPGPRRVLHTTGDLDAVLSRLKAGDLVTFLVYDIAPQGQQGSTRAVTVRVQ